MTFPATDPPTYSTSMTFSRTSPLPSPHLDKRYFDSSLIEMKSQASSSSTLDYDSTEEVWVRRVDFVQERKRKVSLSFCVFNVLMGSLLPWKRVIKKSSSTDNELTLRAVMSLELISFCGVS